MWGGTWGGFDDDVLAEVEMPSSQVQPPPTAAAPPVDYSAHTLEDALAEQFGALNTDVGDGIAVEDASVGRDTVAGRMRDGVEM